MTNRNFKALAAMSLVVGAMGLAPAAYAAETINRNTGVGQQIAAQGNAALHYIRTTLKLAAPKLPKPAKARAVKVSAPAIPASGGGSPSTAGLRCAE